jgi:hypothetical protein
MAKHNCKYEKEIAEMGVDIKYIRKAVDEIKPDVKQNTEFRNKTNGVITFVGAIAGVIGGLLVWIFSKLWGNK